MSRDLKTYNLLLDYLSGRLGEEEKLALEKLWADPEKRSELLELGAIEHGGDAYYRQEFEKLHQQMKLEQSRRTRFIWMAGVAAAAVILIFWLMNFLSIGGNNFDQKEFYADNSPDYLIAQRGKDTSMCQDLPRDSVKIIAALEGKTLDNVCNRLLAVAYFKVEDYRNSYNTWKKVNSDAVFQEEKRFYICLTALKSGHLEEGEKLLSTFTDVEEYSRYKEAAQKLKENLPALIEELESK